MHRTDHEARAARPLGGWARLAGGGAIAVAAVGCLVPEGRPDAPVGLSHVPSAPHRLCVAAGDRPPGDPRCRSPAEVEGLLASADEVLAVAPTPTGSQAARVLTLRAQPGGVVLDAKWRPAASRSPTNAPSAELAAYHVQRLVLAPRDQVVPPTVARCFDVEAHRAWLEDPPRGGCVAGVLSYWLTGAITVREARREGLLPTPPDGVWSADPRLVDRARFERDPTYRRAVANVNAVAFLVGHGDAHTGQFVLYREPFHLFLVDNSRAFGVAPNPDMAARQDLARLVVPAIPEETARRVRALRRRDLAPLADAARGGLSVEELDGVWRRVLRLREALGAGTLATFPG